MIDFDTISGWGSGASGLTPTANILYGDILDFYAQPSTSNDEWAYVEKDISDVYGASYPNYLIRWKTSVGSDGLGAQVVLVFAEGGSETILGSSAPQFSTPWAVTSGTISAPNQTKHVDKIRFYINDYPDNCTSAVTHVYYDFCILQTGVFTFPQVSNVRLNLSKQVARLHPSGRDGDILQDLGMNSIDILLSGKMNPGETWGGGNITYGEYFYNIIHDSDEWQWLTTDRGSFKVKPFSFNLDQSAESDGMVDYALQFIGYSLSPLDSELWNPLYWAGRP